MSSKTQREPKGCGCLRLQLDCSAHAKLAGYKRPAEKARKAALGPVKGPSRTRTIRVAPDTYPAPLVLPEDDLALDPDYPAQDFEEWRDEEDRNEVTAERNVVYVAAPPEIDADALFVEKWESPAINSTGVDSTASKLKGNRKRGRPEVGAIGYSDSETGRSLSSPNTKDVIDYLSAFYHGLKVKPFPYKLKYHAWEGASRKPTKKSLNSASPLPKHIALSISNSPDTATRVRVRSDPTSTFQAQLNLDDILDTAIAALDSLPDAYALLFVTRHDLYESRDDDFQCGRAYGGSRVAVVSTARYNPTLDDSSPYEDRKVEREHAWPASHCTEYVERMCGDDQTDKATITNGSKKRKIEKPATKSKTKTSNSAPLDVNTTPDTPLSAALRAHLAYPLPSASQSPSKNNAAAALSSLWLARALRTASHELGHCFGVDHCVYYACCMQGSASLAEDARQPMYVCPVDEAKILAATGGNRRDRDTALKSYCEQLGERKSGIFFALEEWLRVKIEQDDRDEGRVHQV